MQVIRFSFSAIVLIFFTCTNSLALFTEINNQFLDYMIVSTVNPNYVIEQEKNNHSLMVCFVVFIFLFGQFCDYEDTRRRSNTSDRT